jgi:hypothetical protein
MGRETLEVLTNVLKEHTASSTLNMEAMSSFEKMVNTINTKWYIKPKD